MTYAEPHLTELHRRRHDLAGAPLARAAEFVCPHCGRVARYDATVEAWRCERCDRIVVVEAAS